MSKCPNCEEELTEERGKPICSNCYYEDDYEDIPVNEYQEEREVTERIRKELLPKQKIRIGLVKDWDKKTYGRTKFADNPDKEWWKNKVQFVLLAERSRKKSRGHFIKTATHELGHASKEVRFNPKFNPNSQPFYDGCNTCGEAHRGVGHDRVWHDAYLSYHKRMLKKKFVKNYLKGKK